MTLVSCGENDVPRTSRGDPWTDEEDTLLRRHYRTKGSRYTSEQLKRAGFNRGDLACMRRAARLSVAYEPAYNAKRDRDMTHLADAMPVIKGKAQATRRIVKAARDAGVLSRTFTYPHKFLAPTWWVDQYMAALEEEMQRAKFLSSHWITTKEVAALFGLATTTLHVYFGPAGRAGKGAHVAKYLHAIPSEVVDGYGLNFPPTRFWEPKAAQMQAAAYKRRKRDDPRRRGGGGSRKARD